MANKKNNSLNDNNLNRVSGGKVDPFINNEGLRSYAAKDNDTDETIGEYLDPQRANFVNDIYHRGKAAGEEKGFRKGMAIGMQRGADQALNNLNNR